MDRRAHESAGTLDARQSGVAAAGHSRAGARTRDHGLLSLLRHRRLWHALDHVHRLRDAFSSLWYALQLDLDAADSQGARGIGGDERGFLEHDLSPRRSAVVEARTAGRVDLRDDCLDP